MDIEDKITEINHIRTAHMREREKLDKIVFAITAGTLSLSATFITNSTHIFIHVGYLLTAWFFLIIGLISILFAYTCAILHFKNSEKGIWADKFIKPQDMERNFWYVAADVLNWLSLFSAILGIVYLSYFAYLNLPIAPNPFSV